MEDNINLFEIYNNNYKKIEEISRIAEHKWTDIVDFFDTLRTHELLMYALSYGYQGIVIDKYGCSGEFIVSKVEKRNQIKITITIPESINIKLSYMTTGMKTTKFGTNVSYKRLRELLSQSVTINDVNKHVTNIIRDYLVRPEPKCRYGSLDDVGDGAT